MYKTSGQTAGMSSAEHLTLRSVKKKNEPLSNFRAHFWASLKLANWFMYLNVTWWRVRSTASKNSSSMDPAGVSLWRGSLKGHPRPAIGHHLQTPTPPTFDFCHRTCRLFLALMTWSWFSCSGTRSLSVTFTQTRFPKNRGSYWGCSPGDNFKRVKRTSES